MQALLGLVQIKENFSQKQVNENVYHPQIRRMYAKILILQQKQLFEAVTYDNYYFKFACTLSKKWESSSNIPLKKGITVPNISMALGPQGCMNV